MIVRLDPAPSTPFTDWLLHHLGGWVFVAVLLGWIALAVVWDWRR